MKEFFFFLILVLLITNINPIAYANKNNTSWASLKYNKTYLRTGPSKNNKVIWVYKRKGLPFKILRQKNEWSEVLLPSSQKGWINSSQISKKRNVLIQNTRSSVELALSNQKEIIITDKNLKTLSEIYDVAFEFGLDRNSIIIALGGGIVGDVSGFAAATWLRGIEYIQIPTTLFSMVDSSVGGKTGVNHPKGKNLIGAFNQPKAVFIDPETLKRLPKREFSAGMAEVIKYGVIRDKELFEYLEIEKNKNELINLKNEYLIKIINSSIKTKSYIVSQDEHENGVRAILNYGHSFGHVIENLCGYGKFLHGEAISIGMNIAGKIAIEKGLWSKEELERQQILLDSYDLPTEIPKINKEEVLTILMGDKKVRDGKMRFILPKEIGAVDIYDDVEDSLFLKFFS